MTAGPGTPETGQKILDELFGDVYTRPEAVESGYETPGDQEEHVQSVTDAAYTLPSWATAPREADQQFDIPFVVDYGASNDTGYHAAPDDTTFIPQAGPNPRAERVTFTPSPSHWFDPQVFEKLLESGSLTPEQYDAVNRQYYFHKGQWRPRPTSEQSQGSAESGSIGRHELRITTPQGQYELYAGSAGLVEPGIDILNTLIGAPQFKSGAAPTTVQNGDTPPAPASDPSLSIKVGWLQRRAAKAVAARAPSRAQAGVPTQHTHKPQSTRSEDTTSGTRLKERFIWRHRTVIGSIALTAVTFGLAVPNFKSHYEKAFGEQVTWTQIKDGKWFPAPWDIIGSLVSLEETGNTTARHEENNA